MSDTELILAKLIEIHQTLLDVQLSSKRVLNLEEAAKFTGLSTSTIYKYTSEKKIPFCNPRGKTLYFDRVELEKWLLQNKK